MWLASNAKATYNISAVGTRENDEKIVQIDTRIKRPVQIDIKIEHPAQIDIKIERPAQIDIRIEGPIQIDTRIEGPVQIDIRIERPPPSPPEYDRALVTTMRPYNVLQYQNFTTFFIAMTILHKCIPSRERESKSRQIFNTFLVTLPILWYFQRKNRVKHPPPPKQTKIELKRRVSSSLTVLERLTKNEPPFFPFFGAITPRR
jgi:hypothetical protein